MDTVIEGADIILISEYPSNKISISRMDTLLIIYLVHFACVLSPISRHFLSTYPTAWKLLRPL